MKLLQTLKGWFQKPEPEQEKEIDKVDYVFMLLDDLKNEYYELRRNKLPIIPHFDEGSILLEKDSKYIVYCMSYKINGEPIIVFLKRHKFDDTILRYKLVEPPESK
jgi:hypothetical protein